MIAKFMQEAEEEIAARREEWVALVNQGDLEGYLAMLTEDAVWVPPGRAPLPGKPKIREWLDPLFEKYHYSLKMEPEYLECDGDEAVESCAFVAAITPKLGGTTLTHEGVCILFWERDEHGDWWIGRYYDATPPKA